MTRIFTPRHSLAPAPMRTEECSVLLIIKIWILLHFTPQMYSEINIFQQYKHKLYTLFYRFGSRIDEQSGGREKDIFYRTLILVKDSEVSSMVWCSPSPRTVSLPMVTLDTTTGLPRFLHLLYPRVSPGVSTLLWCTTSQGELIIFHIVLRP